MTLRGASLPALELRPWRANWAVVPLALALAAALATVAPRQPLLAIAGGARDLRWINYIRE